MKKLPKKERQKKLIEAIEEDPFKTDQELADMFRVSIQTIRLDRMELKIPEVRKRTRNLARNAYSKIKSMQDVDIVGDLVEVNLNENGKSIFTPDPEMAFEERNIIRGHYIFAHANSLAAAIINSEVAMTGLSHTKFISPVQVQDRLVAKAHVVRSKNHRFFVRVNTYVEDRLVFKGKFIVFALDDHEILEGN